MSAQLEHTQTQQTLVNHVLMDALYAQQKITALNVIKIISIITEFASQDAQKELMVIVIQKPVLNAQLNAKLASRIMLTHVIDVPMVSTEMD